mgnify:CR=1 FL=1
MIRRHEKNKKTSLFEGLSLIESFCIIVLPILITAINLILIRDILELTTLVSLIISSIITATFIVLIVLLINYLTERY